MALAPAHNEDQTPPRGLAAVHPGELLRDVVLPALKAEGVSKVAVAEALRISRRTLEDLVLEKSAVTPEMALRLGKYLGNGPEVWLGMQRTWDLERAREKLAGELDEITPRPANAGG